VHQLAGKAQVDLMCAFDDLRTIEAIDENLLCTSLVR
jgi:hypothetical protein